MVIPGRRLIDEGDVIDPPLVADYKDLENRPEIFTILEKGNSKMKLLISSIGYTYNPKCAG